MTACIYLIVGLLVGVGVVCELLGSAIKADSIHRDRHYLWTQFQITLDDIKYNKN